MARIYERECGNDYESDNYEPDEYNNVFEDDDDNNYSALTKIRLNDASYKQVLQISISMDDDTNKQTDDTNKQTYDTNKQTDDNIQIDTSLCIIVDKSVDKNIFYIYVPPTGKEYIFPIDPSLTFQSLLDHILYSTNEFIEYYKRGVRYEFVLEQLFHCDENYTSETFLKIPLDSIPVAQGNIVVKNVL